MQRDYVHLLMLVLIGEFGAGRCCLLLCFANAFTDSYITTIGVDFRSKTSPVRCFAGALLRRCTATPVRPYAGAPLCRCAATPVTATPVHRYGPCSASLRRGPRSQKHCGESVNILIFACAGALCLHADPLCNRHTQRPDQPQRVDQGRPFAVVAILGSVVWLWMK